MEDMPNDMGKESGTTDGHRKGTCIINRNK